MVCQARWQFQKFNIEWLLKAFSLWKISSKNPCHDAQSLFMQPFKAVCTMQLYALLLIFNWSIVGPTEFLNIHQIPHFRNAINAVATDGSHSGHFRWLFYGFLVGGPVPSSKCNPPRSVAWLLWHSQDREGQPRASDKNNRPLNRLMTILGAPVECAER